MKNHAKVLHFHDIQKYSAKNFIVCIPLLLMNVVRSFITYHINLKKNNNINAFLRVIDEINL